MNTAGSDAHDAARRFAEIVGDHTLERHCSPATWSEGPVYHEPSQSLIWSDIPNRRMLSWSPQAGVTLFRADSHFSNGNTLDLEGNLITCEHGRRCISRTDAEGRVEVLVDRWQGKRLNSPNDVIVKSDGTIWFTDPPYGIMSDDEGFKADSEIGASHVYRFDPTSGELEAMILGIDRPNGLAFSPDERRLLVSNTSASHDPNGAHEIIVHDMTDGRPGPGRRFCEIAPGLPDGFRFDTAGWLYTSSADAIQVFNPEGRPAGRIAVPEVIANCTFGGKHFDILYIVASTSLYSIRLNTRGAVQRRARFAHQGTPLES